MDKRSVIAAARNMAAMRKRFRGLATEEFYNTSKWRELTDMFYPGGFF
jgi:hypothetical protein